MSKEVTLLKKKTYKFLIIGANGLLGNEFKRILIKKNFLSVARNNADININLKNFFEVKKIFYNYKFNFVINCAAMINLVECEKNKFKCKLINSYLPKESTSLSIINNFKYIHISTDHFFRNKKFTLNKENKKIEKINYYSQSKIIAERYVKKNKKNLIIRTNFTGIKLNNVKSTFIGWVFHNLVKNKKMKLFNDMHTSTLDVNSCARIILKLIEKDATGIYNVGSVDTLSKLDFAIMFAKKLKMKIRYEPISVDEFDIKRGKYLGLDLSKTKKKIDFLFCNITSVINKLVESTKKIK